MIRLRRVGTVALACAALVVGIGLQARADHVEPADELLFYRGDGTFRYYDVRPDGHFGHRLISGDGYSNSWSSIAAVDLDGDGQDELLFYRIDGVYRFYDVGSSGRLSRLLLSGDGYSTGWSSITAVDLDGDGQDELMFYRSDGVYRFYDVGPSGNLSRQLLWGDGYSKWWSSITAVDLEGDGQDELLFYRSDGVYRYYDVRTDRHLSSLIRAGSDYAKGWSSITAVDLDEVFCDNPFTPARIAGLERRYPGQSFTAYVYDTRSGCTFALNPSLRLRTASVFKVMVMAGTLLEAQNDGRSITSWERSQLIPMITESANPPVRALWRHFGGSPWFARQAQIFGLEDTRTVGDGPGAWGTTTTSAEDQVDLLRQVLIGEYGPLEPAYRVEAWELMTSVVRSQTWGVTSGVPAGWTVAQKNGFAGHIANSVGFVQQPGSDEGYVIAVLTNGWPHWSRGVPAVDEIAGWVAAELAH